MKRLHLAALLILVTVALAGCGGKSSPVTTTGITGRVVDTFGSPISGAIIRVGGSTTTSDTTGRFTLTGVSSGKRRVWVTADEHEPYFRTMNFSATVALGDIELTPSPGVSFYAVETSTGSGSISFPNLSGSDIVAVVANRNPQLPGYSHTPTAAAIVEASLPAARVKSKAARRILSAPRYNQDFQSVLRDTERLVARDLRFRGPTRNMFSWPKMLSLNDKEEFWVLRNDVERPSTNADWEKHPATLKYISDNTYIFVDDEYAAGSLTDEEISELGDAFSNSIYARTRNYFGSEPTAPNDTDGDPHVYILISDLSPGIAGYFWAVNELTDAQAQTYLNEITGQPYLHSNQHEMFLLDHAYEANDLKGVLAHEFQHMIFFNERQLNIDSEAPVWINEGFSEMSMEVNDLGTAANNTLILEHMYYYLQDTSASSLVTWDEGAGLGVSDYGEAFLFMRYLTGRFGRDKMKTIMKSPLLGNDAVTAAAPGMTFDDLFTDWTLAMFLDHKGWVDVNNTRFNYSVAGVPDDFCYKTYVGVNGNPDTEIFGPWTYATMPPNDGFRTKTYGVDYAWLKNQSGAQKWTFTPSDPAHTDIIVIRHD